MDHKVVNLWYIFVIHGVVCVFFWVKIKWKTACFTLFLDGKRNSLYKKILRKYRKSSFIIV